MNINDYFQKWHTVITNNEKDCLPLKFSEFNFYDFLSDEHKEFLKDKVCTNIQFGSVTNDPITVNFTMNYDN